MHRVVPRRRFFIRRSVSRTNDSAELTRSKPIHKLDVAAFDWPVAPFPKLKYPLMRTSVNAEEEKRCLERGQDLANSEERLSRRRGSDCRARQAEGGDNHATPSFFRGLRQLCTKHGASFIVDEVQTGGGGPDRSGVMSNGIFRVVRNLIL